MSALTSETVIPGTPSTFAEVRHLVFRGTQRSIGEALGAFARDELGVNKSARWTDPSTTEAQVAWLAEHWPEHHQRTLGAAAAFGADVNSTDQDFSYLHYDWAVPGCSNCFYPPSTTANGHALLSRNYDFTTGTVFELLGRPAPPGTRPATSRPMVVETHPSHGYSTLTMTCYELLGGALDGINSAGVSVALMATVEVLRGGGPAPLFRNSVGLCETHVIRFLLERAGSAAEALALLKCMPQFVMWVPCHFLVADASGQSFLWSNDIAASPVCIEGETDRPVCATNHVPDHRLADIPERDESEARQARFERAVLEAQARSGRTTREGVVAASRTVAATAPPGEGQYQAQSPARTLWHSIYDLETRSLSVDFYLGEGGESGIRRSPYLEFGL